MDNKSILIFGAGKIGRSFIGQLFGQAGYEVIFVDVDQAIVNELNRRKFYPVVIKRDAEDTFLVKNVRAVFGLDHQAVINEIAQTSIIAVSVGKNALEKIMPVLAEGLLARAKTSPVQTLDIIIAENMRLANDFFKVKLAGFLPESYPLDRLVGLVETSIGKMVPIMSEEDLKKDPLLVITEPYNTLILDKFGFKGPIPDVPDLALKENIKAWVDRKAFIHNMGHCTAAYFGAFKYQNANYIYEVLDDNEVFQFTRECMLQAAQILNTIYPREFSLMDLEVYIDDLLERFQNKVLKDTIYRVGSDLIRKLGIGDRFVGIIKLADKHAMPYDKILKAMVYAFYFRKADENNKRLSQDDDFFHYLSNGVEYALEKVCGLTLAEDNHLIEKIIFHYRTSSCIQYLGKPPNWG